ncbi:DUF2207 family protein [Demetria terragena]|uniref:DUF2207 family protein n=1 Tax=Demetria terragena TaxID=63959 RepID=UPI0003AA4822|nr:DUF2207 domain-containing protein [Demetria terragena]
MDMIASVGLILGGLLLAALTWLIWTRRPARHEWWTDGSPGQLVRWAERDRSPVRLGHSRVALAQIPVRVQPPEGVSPAEVGLILSGRVQRRDLSAFVLDMVGRGALELVTGSDGSKRLLAGGRSGLTTAQAAVVAATAGHPQGVPLRSLYDDLKTPLREVAQEILRARGRRWWRPRESAPVWLFVPAAVIMAPTLFGQVLFGGIFGLAAVVILALVSRRSRAGRTAEGTALTIQCLGWRAHLLAVGAGSVSPGGRPPEPELLAWLVAFDLEDAWRGRLDWAPLDAKALPEMDKRNLVQPSMTPTSLAMLYVGGSTLPAGGPVDMCDDLIEGCGGEDGLSLDSVVAGTAGHSGPPGDLPGVLDAGSHGGSGDGGGIGGGGFDGGGFDGGGGGVDGGGGSGP